MLPTSCTYKEVIFKGVRNVEVGKFDKAGIEVTAMVALDNPNSYSIKVKDPDVDVFLNNSILAKARWIASGTAPVVRGLTTRSMLTLKAAAATFSQHYIHRSSEKAN